MRFCLMLSNKGVLDGKRFLKTETVEAMIRDQLPEAVGEIDRRPEGRGFGLGFAMTLDPVRNGHPTSPGTFYWGGLASTSLLISCSRNAAYSANDLPKQCRGWKASRENDSP